MASTAPIGVFDSGLGGISVARQIMKDMPHERVLYFGDSANAPYGTRPPEQVRELSFAIVERFVRQGVKAVVIACNTATSALAACCMMPEIGHITVAARHPGRNAGLKPVAEKFINTHNPYDEIELSDTSALLNAARTATYVINTIPGLAANGIANVINTDSESHAEPYSGLLLDVVYNPRPTKLMQAWRAHGGRAIGGEEMLLYQALIQVLLMTGIWDDDPPSDADKRLQGTTTEDDHLEIAMRNALEEAL